MSGHVVPTPLRGDPAAPSTPSHGIGPGEPMDVECPICYQEYNHYNKCPRMLECLHVFCTECLQRIQVCPADAHGPQAIPCPLCRHLTPLETGDALTLPCNSRILSRLPLVAFHLPVTTTSRVATFTQRVVLSMEGNNRDGRFIILPTVSLQVQQMDPETSYGAAPGLVGEEEGVQQSKKTLFCVQILAVIFWVMFVITCVFGVVFGPNFLNRKL